MRRLALAVAAVAFTVGLVVFVIAGGPWPWAVVDLVGLVAALCLLIGDGSDRRAARSDAPVERERVGW